MAASKRSAPVLHLLNHISPTISPPLLRHLSSQPTDPPPPSSNNTLVTHILTLLRNNPNDWTNNDDLRSLLSNSSHSLSPSSLYQITRSFTTPADALKFLDYIRTNSPSPPDTHSLSSSFQAIFELAAESRGQPNYSPEKLTQLFTLFKEYNIPLNVKSATLLVRCFGRAGLVEQSILVYKELDPDLQNTHLTNVLLSVLLRAGRVDDAFQVLDEMLLSSRDGKCLPNESTVDIVMGGLLWREANGRKVSEEEIVGLVSKFGEHSVFPSPVRLTQLITKLCKSGKIVLAWDVLRDVMKTGGNVQASSCNALLTGLGRNRDYPTMNKLLVEMKENGVEPDVITFGILVNHLCKFRRVDEALEVLEKMGGGSGSFGFSVTPDTVLYNTLVDGFCKVGRQEKGFELMERMRSQGCEPNTVTYNCLIDGFCKAGEIDRARELFDEMNKEGVPPNVITVNSLVGGMCKHGRINSAMEFFNEMQGKGLKGNAVTYTALISAFCNVNNIDKAMQLFSDMSTVECSPDAIVYYALIAGLTQAGRLDDASFIASQMKKDGFSLDVPSYNTLIGGFCRKNKLDKAYGMLKEMEQAGVKPDGVTYNTLISYFSKVGDLSTAHRFFRKMIDEGLVPNVVTYGALIHAYCLVGNLDEAMKIFTKMSSGSRVPPNTVIYNMLIDSLCKNNKVEVALSLMDDMMGKGVRPNTNTFNAMLKGLQETNGLEKAFELMNQMTKQACNPDYVTMEILTNWLSAVGETKKLKIFVQRYEVSASTALVVGSVFKALKNDLLLYCSGSSKGACSIVYIFMAILFIRPGFLGLQGKAFYYRIAEVMFMFFMFQTLLGILAKGKRRQGVFPDNFQVIGNVKGAEDADQDRVAQNNLPLVTISLKIPLISVTQLALHGNGPKMQEYLRNIRKSGASLELVIKDTSRQGWRQVTSDAGGGKMLSTMTMETNSITSTDVEVPTASGESLLFKRAVRRAHFDDDDTDFCCLQKVYITVTALGALSDSALDCQAYLKEWLPGVAGRPSSSAL
ncbi:hypothetical protein Vadar_005739 [Vaccinium darrowii]|uniref:Uncharacterized protein n=1 Tax=Vaccinium darrowii TaxID=229202 RepID=A0ACB7ZAA4_9ERIC|nr:hypothetical protein Vadar_005739 [Vaccinium darrowii]